jgi:hypothetical protein
MAFLFLRIANRYYVSILSYLLKYVNNPNFTDRLHESTTGIILKIKTEIQNR